MAAPMNYLLFFVILLSCFQHCSLKRGGGSRGGGSGGSSSSSSGGGSWSWPSSSGSSSSSSWSSWSYSNSWHPWTSWSSGYDSYHHHGYGSSGTMPTWAIILIVIIIIVVLIYFCAQIADRSHEETPERTPFVSDPKVPVWPTVYPPHPEPTTASSPVNKPMTDSEKMFVEVQDEVAKRYEKILSPLQKVRPSAPPTVESSFMRTT